jgi:predicted 3-demethylubiquinone-9 3-methyltransferase (glyoxalase superfamily)
MGIPDEDKLKGKVLTGIFELKGLEFMCLDGPSGVPGFGPTSVVSFLARFETQDELDKVWDRLMDGGKPQQCGWIVDKFGVTWQIVPAVMDEMISDPNATFEQKKALTAAMMPMVKLDGDKLKAAFDSAK